MLTLPATRLLIPARGAPERLLERTRLLKLLTERRRKLMLLVAPAGFGKTTLALDYIATSNLWQVGEAAAWLSLDLGGIVKWDSRIFIQALSLALKNALPALDLTQVEQEINALTPGQELSEEIAAQLVFLVANALSRQPRPVLLAIDDYHLVCDERSVRDAQLINNLVNTLLVTSPGQLRILICSRAYPTLDVLKLSVEDELVVINKELLKFNQDEIKAFLAQRGKDAALSDQVEKESEGWAAAVALKLQNLDMEAHLKDQNYGRAMVASVRYNTLAEEMLKQLERPLRRLLEACSVLDVIEAEVAGYLISCYEAIEVPVSRIVVAEQLGRLETLGLVERNSLAPAKVTDTESTVLYRLHNLLKDYLKNSLEPVAIEALNNAAGSYYRKHEDKPLAFDHFLVANDHATAAEVLEEYAQAQFRLGSNLTELEQQVSRLHESALSNHPYLLLVAGITSHTAGHVDKALAYYHASNRRWGRYDLLDRLVYSDELDMISTHDESNDNKQLPVTRLLGKAETIICMARLWETTGRNTRAIGALESVKNILSKLSATNKNEEQRNYVLGLARRYLGNCYRQAAQYKQSIEELNHAINIFLQLDDHYNVACCQHNLGIAWRQLGNQPRAEESFNHAKAYWERQGNFHQLSITLNSLGNGLTNEGRYEEALALLLEALEKGRDAGNEMISQYILAGLGDAYLGLRDQAKALSYYAQSAAEASRQNNFEILTYAKLGTARTLRRAGEAAQTRQAVLAALDYAEESNDSKRAAAAVEYGAYQAVFSRLEMASAQLEGAATLAHKVQNHNAESLAHFWLAYVHVRLDRYKLAYDAMRKALNIAQELGYDAFLYEEAAELPDLMEHFRALPNDPVGAFFSRDENYAADATTNVEIRAFGKGRIFRGEQEVPSISRKARELIFYLLEQRTPVSGEQLSEVLWPDAQLAGNGLGSAFYSTITHARRALGGADTIRAADGSYSLNLRYRYDVEHFEEQLRRAERTTELQKRTELFEGILALATNDFLIDTDNGWAQPRREELRQKKLRALSFLAEAYLQQSQLERALELLGRWMSADPYDEQPLRRYVELLAQVKSKTIALNFLRRKMEELRDEKIEPEDQTQQLFEQLDSSRTVSKRRRA